MTNDEINEIRKLVEHSEINKLLAYLTDKEEENHNRTSSVRYTKPTESLGWGKGSSKSSSNDWSWDSYNASGGEVCW